MKLTGKAYQDIFNNSNKIKENTNIDSFFARVNANAAPKVETPAAIPDIEIVKTEKQHFLTAYTNAEKTAITASKFIAIDARTTAQTPYSCPVTMFKEIKVGNWIWSAYQILFGKKFSVKQRARILTVLNDSDEVLSFDLDLLSNEDKENLFKDVFASKQIIGHDLASTFQWMDINKNGNDTINCIDTMLIARSVYPRTCHLNAESAGHGDESSQTLIKTAGFSPTAINSLISALNIKNNGKSWESFATWTVANLNENHALAAERSVKIVAEILKKLTNTEEIDCSLIKLTIDDAKNNNMYFDVYGKTPATLSYLTNSGIAINKQSLTQLQSQKLDEIEPAANELVALVPHLAPFLKQLSSTAASTTGEIKQALSTFATQNGITLEIAEDESPVVGYKSAKFVGATNLDGWKAWEKLQEIKQIFKNCDEVLSNLDSSSVLHPLFSATTSTMRLTAKVPNTMAMSSEIKGLFKAEPGQTFLSVDMSQIELRICAALANRAINEVSKSGAFAKFSGRIAQVWKRLESDSARPMADAFAANIDVHLLTAMSIAIRQGLLTLNETPLNFLKSRTPEQIAELKTVFSRQRRSAKVINLGLIYDMSAKGLHKNGVINDDLDWSVEDAAVAKSDWMDLYPELEFLQLYNKALATETKMVFKRRWDKKYGVQEVNFGESTTLSGRKIYAGRELLNHASQGSCADILLDTFTSLPKNIAKHVINLVHDEIVMLVASEEANAAEKELTQTMLAAANKLLNPWGVSAAVDAEQSLFLS